MVCYASCKAHEVDEERARMSRKDAVFYVKDIDEHTLHEVDPFKSEFDGSYGPYDLLFDITVHGTRFYAGRYPFQFWDVPIYDERGEVIGNSFTTMDTPFPDLSRFTDVDYLAIPVIKLVPHGEYEDPVLGQ